MPTAAALLSLALAAGAPVPLGPIMAPEVEAIEVVYVSERAPQVTLRPKVAQTPAPPWRPRGSTVSLLERLDAPRGFGACEARARGKGLIVARTAGDPRTCGAVIALDRNGSPLDALSFSHLRVRGRATATVRLALIDEALAMREDNAVIAHLGGPFDVRISLRDGARRLDPRRLTGVVVLTRAAETLVNLEVLNLEQGPPGRPKLPTIGFWLWRYREALTKGREVLDACKRHRCNRLLVQMPSLADTQEVWEDYARFFSLAREQGIEAWALDGEPQAVHDSLPIVKKVGKLKKTFLGQDRFGLQLDIEPYILPGFLGDEPSYLRYLGAIDAIRRALPEGARLSVVMPFWFVSQIIRGRPLAFEVMDRADEVAIMSYRTDLDELAAIAEDTLHYGDLIGTPVWLSLETTALPVERHVILKHEQRREFADAYLDRANQRLVFERPPAGRYPKEDWFRIHHRVTVRPERLSFAGARRTNLRRAVKALFERLRHPSLAGVMIHDLDGFLALSE